MNDERDDRPRGRHSRHPHSDGRDLGRPDDRGGTPPGPPPPPGGQQRPGPRPDQRPGNQGWPPQRPPAGPQQGGPAWPGEDSRSGGPQWPDGDSSQDTQRHQPVPPPGQQGPGRSAGQRPEAEKPEERTNAWVPSFDDSDDDGSSVSQRLNGDGNGSGRGAQPPNGADGRRADQPTTYSSAPPPPPPGQQPGRQGPPPPPQGTQQVPRPGQQPPPPGPPGPGRPGQQGPGAPPGADQGERPTENIPQTPSDGREARWAAAGGAAAAGAAGAAAAAGGAGSAGAGAREPQLLTHQESPGAYDYYADDYDDDPYDDGYSDNASHESGYDDDDRFAAFGPGDDDLDDPDDDVNAAKARRSNIWRWVRRSCYIAVAAGILVPMAIAVYGYFAWPVPNPEEIAKQTQQTITVNYSNGQEMTRIQPQEGKPRTMIHSLDEVSPAMRNATMAAEDASFYSNPGFDVMGIVRSALAGTGGGSTLTQQYIKLELNADQHTYTRKFREVVLAFKMTQQQSKDQILMAYLNTAFYGRGAYGINSAAENYFGKKPKDLNPEEAAVLAGMVQRPYDNDPAANLKQATWRWNYVMDQMVKNHFISPAERQAAQLPQTRGRDDWRGEAITGTQYHIREAALRELEQEGYSQDALARGGFTITTTIDPKAQQYAEQAVNDVTNGEPDDIRTSLVAVDPKTGQVKAYYGGGQKVGGFDYANAAQPPGSSFKPFVALTGLEQNKGVGLFYDGSSPQEIAGTTFRNSAGVACDVPNHCGVREAMTKSVNTVFVNMAVQFGPQNVANTAYQAGIPKQYGGKESLHSPNGGVDAGIALGMYGVRPLDMAGAYATFANDGMKIQPHLVSKISNSEKTIPFDKPVNQPAFASTASESKNLVANLVDTMFDVADHSHIGLDNNRPVASKTGTNQYGSTSDNQNAWMVGSTRQLSSAVAMLAEKDGKPAPLTDHTGKIVYGAGLPGHVWQEFMNLYHKNLPIEQFPKPTPIGQFQDIPLPPPPTSSEPPPSSSEPPSSSLPPSESTDPSESETSPTRTRPGSGEHCGLFGCTGGDGTGGGDGTDTGDGQNAVGPTQTRDNSYG